MAPTARIGTILTKPSVLTWRLSAPSGDARTDEDVPSLTDEDVPSLMIARG
jgi:hypothetical protein